MFYIYLINGVGNRICLHLITFLHYNPPYTLFFLSFFLFLFLHPSRAWEPAALLNSISVYLMGKCMKHLYFFLHPLPLFSSLFSSLFVTCFALPHIHRYSSQCLVQPMLVSHVFFFHEQKWVVFTAQHMKQIKGKSGSDIVDPIYTTELIHWITVVTSWKVQTGR